MTYPNGDEAAWSALFEARIVDGVPEPGDDETAEVRWVADEEALDLEIARHRAHARRDPHGPYIRSVVRAPGRAESAATSRAQRAPRLKPVRERSRIPAFSCWS